MSAAAVLTVPRSGPLCEAVVRGMQRDPLLVRPDGTGEPLAAELLEAGQPWLAVQDLEGRDEGAHLAAIRRAGFSSALAVPLAVGDRIIGLLTAYGARDAAALEDDHLQAATALAATAAVAYANCESWGELERVNRGLEEEVEERTRELAGSLAEVRQLATELGEKNRLLARANEELSALDRFRDHLMERLAGALRGPVSSVLNAARLLEERPPGRGDKDALYVTIVREQAGKLSELVETVSQASLLSGNELPAERRAVPVQELLRRAVTPLRDLARRRRVELNVLVPSALASVLCEPAATEAALRALLKNAIEFNHGESPVKLELRQLRKDEQAWLIVRVSDTGIGIAAADLPRVFEPFWQGSDGASDHSRGLGLGLTIAKRVAEAHGGTIAIASPDGRGVQVTLSLPQ